MGKPFDISCTIAAAVTLDDLESVMEDSGLRGYPVSIKFNRKKGTSKLTLHMDDKDRVNEKEIKKKFKEMKEDFE